MDNQENLDSRVKELILQSRRADKKRKELKDIIKDIILRGQPEIDIKEIGSLVNYILSQLVTKKYCERNLYHSYEDNNIVYTAKSVPALKKDSTRYFMSGDSHFFYKLGKKQYLIGRMDGMGHGVEAGIIVLVARKYLDKFVGSGTYDPKLLAENLNERFTHVFGDARFATMFVSLLKDKRILVTNVGEGETFIYDSSNKKVEKIESHGFDIGMLALEDIEKLNQPYVEEERRASSGFTIVSYTDGINEREKFDHNHIKKVIKGNIGDIGLTINKIFGYADKLGKGLDDSTVIGLYIK